MRLLSGLRARSSRRLAGGRQLTVSAAGPDAREAVAILSEATKVGV